MMLVVTLISFALQPTPRTRSIVCATNGASSLAWTSLKSALDETVPVFVVTDAESRPLEYERASSNGPMLLCFAGIGGAQAALDRASAKQPALQLRIQPVGLGTALERVREGRAELVAAAQDLEVARSVNPDGEDWDGGALPLFGCHQLSRQRRDGSTATPLWLSVEEAKAALAEIDPKRDQGLHLVCTSLQSMSSLIEQGEMGPIDVVPTRRALEFCKTGMVMGGVADDDEGGLPPGVTQGAFLRALPEIFGEGPSAYGGASGLFPS